MVILNKTNNSFKVILRDFEVNRGKVKVKNEIENSNLIFDCLFIPSNKGLTEVRFVSGDAEVELLEWVSYIEEKDGVLESKECLIEQLNIDLFQSPKNANYLIEVMEDKNRLFYGELLITDEEDIQEYKTYKNQNVIKI